MSAYGCCTLWMCICDDEDPKVSGCDECPYYDTEFFRKEAEIANTSNQDQR